MGADRPLLFQDVTDEEPWPALPFLDWRPEGQSLGSDHSLTGSQLPTAHRCSRIEPRGLSIPSLET